MVACMHACVRACVRECVRECVRAGYVISMFLVIYSKQPIVGLTQDEVLAIALLPLCNTPMIMIIL